MSDKPKTDLRLTSALDNLSCWAVTKITLAAAWSLHNSEPRQPGPGYRGSTLQGQWSVGSCTSKGSRCSRWPQDDRRFESDYIHAMNRSFSLHATKDRQVPQHEDDSW